MFNKAWSNTTVMELVVIAISIFLPFKVCKICENRVIRMRLFKTKSVGQEKSGLVLGRGPRVREVDSQTASVGNDG